MGETRCSIIWTILKPQTELLRLSRINFSEAYQILAHLKTVRLFVESVLRYGLPADYAGVIVKVRRLWRWWVFAER